MLLKFCVILVVTALWMQYTEGQLVKDGLDHLKYKLGKVFRGKATEDEIFDGEVWTGVSNVLGVSRTTWFTGLASGMFNESAFMSENRNFVLLISMDDSLDGAGYDNSISLLDFNSDMFGIRIRLPGTSAGPAESPTRSRSSRRRNRNNEACFIGRLPVTLMDVKNELMMRSNVQVNPISIGTPKIFVTKESNTVNDAVLSTQSQRLANFCKKAVKANKAYMVSAPGPNAAAQFSTITVLGQFDDTQSTSSVPYEIRMEAAGEA